MPLIDLGDYLSDDSIRIPLKTPKRPEGKIYTIPSPDVDTGIWLTALAQMGSRIAAGDKTITEADVEKIKMEGPEEESFVKIVLGEAYQEMKDDGVKWVQLQRLAQYAFAYFSMGPEAAQKGVESGAFSGKAPANRAQRRTAVKSAQPVSADSKPRPARKPASRGTRSSSTGV